eukprot:15432280-Alexandrium_andersonii.AAC.1
MPEVAGHHRPPCFSRIPRRSRRVRVCGCADLTPFGESYQPELSAPEAAGRVSLPGGRPRQRPRRLPGPVQEDRGPRHI